MDGESAALKPLITAMPGGPHVNLASANGHIPDIERRIRVVKERSCETRRGLPFQRILQLMVIHMVLLVVKMINCFPPKRGVSAHMSPKTTISGQLLDYKNILASHSENIAKFMSKRHRVIVILRGPMERSLSDPEETSRVGTSSWL